MVLDTPMDEVTGTDAVEWMRHGIELVIDMLRAADELIRRGGLTVGDKRRLQHELTVRQRVLAVFTGAEEGPLTEVETAWRTYLLKHAALEVQRARNLIDEAAFLQASYRMLDERRAAIEGNFKKQREL